MSVDQVWVQTWARLGSDFFKNKSSPCLVGSPEIFFGPDSSKDMVQSGPLTVLVLIGLIATANGLLIFWAIFAPRIREYRYTTRSVIFSSLRKRRME